MPKKSRRRAKTGGGSGGGKGPGGGGGGTGRGGGDKNNQQTAKNSDDEIENNIQPAGTLTAGAVRMFSECTRVTRHSVPKKSAPILQIVSDLKGDSDVVGADPLSTLTTYTWCCDLSDGARCITARFSSQHTHGFANLLATNQVMRHSVIRVPSYSVLHWETDKSGVFREGLFVLRTEIVERDAGRVLGRTLPTSCPVDGILTVGAIRMLLKMEVTEPFSFARESRPVLQVMGDPVSHYGDDFDGYMLELSDGKDWTKGLVISDIDTALVYPNLITRHSLIRVDTCMSVTLVAVRSGVPVQEDALLLGGLEVVATNVGHLIGKPTKVKKNCSPISARSSSPSSGRVRDTWPYDVKLHVARAYCIETDRLFGDNGSGDVGAALHHVSSYFQLPREQTELFRAAMLMHWRGLLEQWISVMLEQDGGNYERFFANERAIGLLKRLSSVEGGECVLVRAMASFIRGRTGTGICLSFDSGGSLSNSLICLRRFSVLLGECDLTELASAYDAVTIGGPSGKIMAEGLISDCKEYLNDFGGPSQNQVLSMFDQPLGYELPFYFTVGGNFCDCCGKAPEEANLPILFKCKACRLAWYCSASCQAACWANGHRDWCKKFGRFEKGDMVMLQGLKKRRDLNSTLVSVKDLPLNGRAVVCVLVPMDRSVKVGAVISIKKENLRHHRPLK